MLHQQLTKEENTNIENWTRPFDTDCPFGSALTHKVLSNIRMGPHLEQACVYCLRTTNATNLRTQLADQGCVCVCVCVCVSGGGGGPGQTDTKNSDNFFFIVFNLFNRGCQMRYF